MSGPIDVDAEHFEARFREEEDPWGIEHAPYEHAKRARTLQACGDGPFGRALELGAAGGVLSERLAERCTALTTIDIAPTAVRRARTRLARLPHVSVLEGAVPDDLPDAAPHDLVVASEILYYLPADAYARTLRMLPATLAPGGRLVAVHWAGTAPDLQRSARRTHADLRDLPGLVPVPGLAHDATAGYLLDVLEAG